MSGPWDHMTSCFLVIDKWQTSLDEYIFTIRCLLKQKQKPKWTLFFKKAMWCIHVVHILFCVFCRLPMKSVLKLTVLSEDTAAVLEYSPAQKINLLSGYLFSFSFGMSRWMTYWIQKTLRELTMSSRLVQFKVKKNSSNLFYFQRLPKDLCSPLTGKKKREEAECQIQIPHWHWFNWDF